MEGVKQNGSGNYAVFDTFSFVLVDRIVPTPLSWCGVTLGSDTVLVRQGTKSARSGAPIPGSLAEFNIHIHNHKKNDEHPSAV